MRLTPPRDLPAPGRRQTLCVAFRLEQSPVFLVNSRLGPSAAAPSRGRPFSRSYGSILPSSLTAVDPIASAFSASPPVSVSVRAAARSPAAFLGRPSAGFAHSLPPWRGAGRRSASLPPPRASGTGTSRTRTRLSPASPPRVLIARRRCGNVDPLSIGCALRPRLRPRLTLGGRAFPRKPRASGGWDSRPALATRASILAPARSTLPRRQSFAARGTLPYRSPPCGEPAASAPCLAP